MPSILLMEDDPDHSMLMSEVLMSVGHEVTVRSTGSDAWNTLLSTRFDLLISDIYVKVSGAYVSDGGVSLLGKIRMPRPVQDTELVWLKDLPILAISGGITVSGGHDPLRQARDMGANAMLRKPVPIDLLLSTVHELLEHAAAQHQSDV